MDAKTSEQWQRLFPEIIVVDADGWDSHNFDYSWSREKISLQEYLRRRRLSSCIAGKREADDEAE